MHDCMVMLGNFCCINLVSLRCCQVASAREDKMRKVLSALAVLASSSGVSSERETFLQLVSLSEGVDEIC